MRAAMSLRFAPQAVLPAQFDIPRTPLPEEQLMLAVLEDALEIHRKYPGLPGRREQRLLAEVEHWLFSDDTQWPFSFVNVCQTLGIDVAWIRAQLGRPVPPERMWGAVRHRCHVVR